jgi:hypothetical protein
MINYIRRELKFLIYLSIIFVLVLVIIPLIIGQQPKISWNELMQESRLQVFLVLLLAYALVYPVIAYTSVKRHLNGSFEDNREVFEKTFDTLGYIKTLDSPEKIVYRKKSAFVRFLQWYEDAIEIIPGENPVIISGLRKAVTRIDRIVDQLLLKGAGN